MNPLKAIFCFSILIASALYSASPSPVPSPSPRLPTLEDETSKGFIPYHELTVDDFPINDQVHPDTRFWVKTFVHPYWWAQYRFSRSSIYAYIGGWVVFSGLDKNESSRKSWSHNMNTDLSYAQALLDINEIHGLRLAALRPGELPRGQGISQEATRADLTKRMKLFCEREYELMQADMDEFAKATNKGSNQKKVRELGAEIKKRLGAVPLPSPSLSGDGKAVATPVATVTVSSTVAPQSK